MVLQVDPAVLRARVYRARENSQRPGPLSYDVRPPPGADARQAPVMVPDKGLPPRDWRAPGQYSALEHPAQYAAAGGATRMMLPVCTSPREWRAPGQYATAEQMSTLRATGGATQMRPPVGQPVRDRRPPGAYCGPSDHVAISLGSSKGGATRMQPALISPR